MLDVRSFQLYVLSFMRAAQHVESTLRSMSATRDEMGTARKRLLDAGVQEPGHHVELYKSLLGPGFGDAERQATDPYKVHSLRFHLPLWTAFDFVVYSNIRGEAGEVRFERPPGQTAPSQGLTEIRAWEIVENDLVLVGWPCEITDEWYPRKDLECRVAGDTRVLCFDFGLLQRVTLRQPPAS